MWYKVKTLYDNYTLQDRRNQLGQYELRDLLEKCGYVNRFREASFLFQYYRFAKFYEEIFMRKAAPPVQVQPQTHASTSSPVESKTRTHNGRVGSARRTADGGAGRSWAEQGADISVGPEANRPSSPPGYRKQLF